MPLNLSNSIRVVLEIFETDLAGFAAVLQSANHTLKRALTDPRLFSGVGNAYSDEILWEACLSPVALTQKLSPDQIKRLYEATRATLTKWTDLLRNELVTQTVSLRTSRKKLPASRGSSPTVREGWPFGAVARPLGTVLPVGAVARPLGRVLWFRAVARPLGRA